MTRPNIPIEPDGLRLITLGARPSSRSEQVLPFRREGGSCQLASVPTRQWQIGLDGVQLLGGHGHFTKEHPSNAGTPTCPPVAVAEGVRS